MVTLEYKDFKFTGSPEELIQVAKALTLDNKDASNNGVFGNKDFVSKLAELMKDKDNKIVPDKVEKKNGFQDNLFIKNPFNGQFYFDDCAIKDCGNVVEGLYNEK